MQLLPPFDKIGVIPTPPFVNANPSSGITGSIINAEIFNALQAEILAIQGGAGLAQNPNDYTQAYQAIRSGLLAYYDDTGAANAPTISPANPAVTQLVDGMFFRVKMANAPTGPAVFHVNSLSASIVRRGGAALTGGEWISGDVVGLTYSAAAGGFQISGLAISDLAPGFKAYTTPGTYTWTVPAGVYTLRAVVATGGGGSGAGASGSSYPCTGGTAAGTAVKFGVPVNPGDTFTVVVGAAGAAVAASVNGVAGNVSSITTATGGSGISLVAHGGLGGQTSTGAGSVGGTASGGDLNFQGGPCTGAPTLQSGGQRAGSGGGNSLLGQGGQTSQVSNGGTATGFGAGGGSGSFDGTTYYGGWAGSSGAVFIFY